MPHLQAKPSPMQRTGALQPIVKENYALGGNLMTAAELYTLREKQRAKPIRFDMAGPTRITNAAMPKCTKPLFEVPAHLTPERIEASHKPRVQFGKRYYPCGRIEALDGTVIQESTR